MSIKITERNLTLPITELVPWVQNPRIIRTKDFERLKRQLAKHGQFKNLIAIRNGEAPSGGRDPKLPDRTFIIIGGNMRLRAMQELGFAKVSLTHIRCETHADMVELSLADNDRAGMYDDQLLSELIYPHLSEIPLEDYKADIGQAASLQDMLESFIPDIEEREDALPPATEEETWVERGDLFTFDGHKLLCGDATEPSHIQALMQTPDGRPEQASLIFTDPPYNVSYKGSKYDKIMGDSQTEEEFIEFTLKFMANLKAALRPGGVFYICSGYSSYPIFLYAMRHEHLQFSNPIIWVKNYQSQGWQDYRLQHEMLLRGRRAVRLRRAQPILYGWREGRHYFADTRFEADVWQIRKRSIVTMLHPTQKPIALITRALLNSSKSEDIVLDPFCGSGSTLIASEKSGRHSRSADLDPRWIQTTLKRYSNYTGKDLSTLTASKRNILQSTIKGGTPKKPIKIKKKNLKRIKT